jgi:cysteine synthase A
MRDVGARAVAPTVIEGIGRPSVEAGFLFDVVDEVVEVADAASIAAMHLLESLFGRPYGGSSGTNFVGCLELAAAMRVRGERGSIVSLLCDHGERYTETLFNPGWLHARAIEPALWRSALETCLIDGRRPVA